MPAHSFEEIFDGNHQDGRNNYSRAVPGDICITGFSGRLPESSNIEEFKKNLFDGVDMVNEEPRRWKKGLYGLSDRMGKIKDDDLSSFDQQFFSIHQKQAECMDPQIRMLLEITHEAIIDAGINPVDIRGSRTGVYVGVSTSESESYWLSEPEIVNGYGLPGCSRAMIANRISYSFDFKGPSYSVDTGCSSSMYALEQAFSDIRYGKCDSALVAGVNIILMPTMSLQTKRLTLLSNEGMCRTFDESGAGYVRSDGCVAIFLQHSACAKRLYATILNVRTNTDGYKEQGISFPNGRMQHRLIRETYAEINVDPNMVNYVEAHGTGTKAGDPEEVNSITDFYCKNRTTPLLIGSVKSNMGHSEAAAGVCSIAKVLIAMEEGVIPANLHYTKPNPELYGLMDGRLKVVDSNIPWNGGIVGINSFGFGGANAHLILRSNPKSKMITPRVGPPKLVVCSGRTYDAVQHLLEGAIDHRDDDEFLALIHGIYSRSIPLHNFRGYCVMNSTGVLQREALEYGGEERPIWFIYTGMGSQWKTVDKELMVFEVFKNSIHRCAEALRPEGVDLIDLLYRSQSFENIVNSFISFTAIQVALTDLLTSLNIQPDGIVGHSIGELGCAYADGCFTPEQTILAAYWRGKSIQETPLPKGKMAAIGLSWEEAHKRLPADCFPVCHNCEDNCAVSGPEQSIDSLVEQLDTEGVFARVVESKGYAFHSKYIANAGPKLQKNLEKIIPNAKNRTSRWLSTSIPESAWNNPIAKQSSAAYHVNNLLSPVLFNQVLKHIPKNAICIEISRHGLLQAILKRALGTGVTNLSLSKQGHNNVEFFLKNIGKLYAAGANPHLINLVRPVSFPVGRGTPMLSSKVGWNHSQKWLVPKFGPKTLSGETSIEIDLSKEDNTFLAGHTIDGRILFPATGYMILVWKTYAKKLGNEFIQTPVIMENVVFHRDTILNKEKVVKFDISFCDSSGNFEICEGGYLVVSGKITIPDHVEREEFPLDALPKSTETKEIITNDVYKELHLRGYDYSGLFRGIISSDAVATTGKLQWANNWISFMDTMLQFSFLSRNLRELYLPARIERTVIYPGKHLELIASMTKEQQVQQGVPVFMYEKYKVIKCGGIELRGVKAAQAQKRSSTQKAPSLKQYTFIPNVSSVDLHKNSEVARLQALIAAVYLVIENSGGALKIKGIELVNGCNPYDLMAPKLIQAIENEPTMSADVAVVVSQKHEKMITNSLCGFDVRIISKNIMKGAVEKNCNFVYALDVLSRHNTVTLEHSIASIRENGFLIFEENVSSFAKTGHTILEQFGFISVYEQSIGSSRVLVLAKRITDFSVRNYEIVCVTEKNYDWLDALKAALAKANDEGKYVYIVNSGEEIFGAVGFFNCIKEEAGGKFARLVYIQDKGMEKFSLNSPFFSKQMSKDLITNVYKNGAWGCFVHIKIESTLATRPVEHAYVNTTLNGDLASLKWIEGPIGNRNLNCNDDLEMCTVYYAPINFRDVLLSSGKLSADELPDYLAQKDRVLGVEFAGRDSSGNRVMAMVPANSLATTCVASKRTMWQVPENWSMEEASTVPWAYATVYFALVVRGHMKKGEKILIHAGCGGVGLAAISVALHNGLTVFTTVGSKEEREFLKQRFPQLQDRFIGCSRDCSFEYMIMHETQGRGVDLILNLLAEEQLQASVRCLGFNGRFLEIGKTDLRNNSALSMSMFLKNTSFIGIQLDSFIEAEESTQNQVVVLVAEGIKSGAVRPLPTSVFNEMQLEQAFLFMASGKHIGKVIIKLREEEHTLKIIKPEVQLVNATPRTYMHREKSYIIVGGLGGFGLELTNWLVSRGATNIVLNSRSGFKTGYQCFMVNRWQERNCKVLIDTNDVATSEGCKQLLENANKLAPVGGIFNLAAVLRDALIENQTVESFKAACEPKVNATKQLDKHSRDLCSELDYFVCFSSVSCARGNIGQANYGLANSTMERICERRQACGFPATAIQWGAIGDTGLVIENYGNNVIIIGTLPQCMASCLLTIDTLLQQPHAVLSSMVIADTHTSEQSSASCFANILGLRDLNGVQDSTKLVDLGMDSLMNAEIKNILERNFDVVMSAAEIRKLTFNSLKQLGSTRDNN